MAEHWERPRHPDGKFKKKSLRETDVATEFRKNMEESGAVTRFTNLADAVAQMQAEHFESQQLVERLRSVIEVDHNTQRELRDRIATLLNEKNELIRQLEETRSAQSIRASAIRRLEHQKSELETQLKDYTAQEGLPSRLRKATEQLDETRAVLLRQVHAIDKVIHPEG